LSFSTLWTLHILQGLDYIPAPLLLVPNLSAWVNCLLFSEPWLASSCLLVGLVIWPLVYKHWLGLTSQVLCSLKNKTKDTRWESLSPGILHSWQTSHSWTSHCPRNASEGFPKPHPQNKLSTWQNRSLVNWMHAYFASAQRRPVQTQCLWLMLPPCSVKSVCVRKSTLLPQALGGSYSNILLRENPHMLWRSVVSLLGTWLLDSRLSFWRQSGSSKVWLTQTSLMWKCFWVERGETGLLPLPEPPTPSFRVCHDPSTAVLGTDRLLSVVIRVQRGPYLCLWALYGSHIFKRTQHCHSPLFQVKVTILILIFDSLGTRE
jgi:hypothetical protein